MMRTPEERLAKLHRRAAELKRERNKKALRGWGGVSVTLLFVLVAAFADITGGSGFAGGSGMTGATLLGDSAGGYVLAAVIAFTLGVIVTAILYRNRKRR